MKKSKSSISVIIPVYNREDYVVEAIVSVLAHEPDEVIVVDDGSTDNSVDIIKQKYSDNNKVKLIEVAHTGKPGATRNVGIKQAKGDYIAFQDSDDVWTSEHALKERVVQLADNPKAVLSYTNAVFNFVGKKPLRHKLLVQKHQTLAKNTFYKLISKHPTPVPTPTVIVKRSLIEEIGLFSEELEYGEDNEFWIRASLVGNFLYSSVIGAKITRDNRNISSLPYETGKQALFKHEQGHIKMFESLLGRGGLDQTQIEAVDYRINELKHYVNELAEDLGEEPVYQLAKNPSLSPPIQLQEANRQLTRTLAAKIDRILAKIFFFSPALYKQVKNALKKLLQPFRKVV